MNEADIAEELVHAFPEDEIQREGKGGDILQTVRYPCGGKLEQAGVILYECKDTKRWSNAFIEPDQDRRTNAPNAVPAVGQPDATGQGGGRLRAR